MRGNKVGFLLLCVLILAIAVFGLYKTVNESNSNNENTKIEQNNLNNVEENRLIATEIELGSFSTTIYDTNKNRVNNIKIACDALNGYVLAPGQTFSFNELIGPYTKQKGYAEATGLDSKGNRIPMVGGGVCQVSSTLYNLAMELNFTITERHEHSNEVRLYRTWKGCNHFI